MKCFKPLNVLSVKEWTSQCSPRSDAVCTFLGHPQVAVLWIVMLFGILLLVFEQS